MKHGESRRGATLGHGIVLVAGLLLAMLVVALLATVGERFILREIPELITTGLIEPVLG